MTILYCYPILKIVKKKERKMKTVTKAIVETLKKEFNFCQLDVNYLENVIPKIHENWKTCNIGTLNGWQIKRPHTAVIFAVSLDDPSITLRLYTTYLTEEITESILDKIFEMLEGLRKNQSKFNFDDDDLEILSAY